MGILNKIAAVEKVIAGGLTVGFTGVIASGVAGFIGNKKVSKTTAVIGGAGFLAATAGMLAHNHLVEKANEEYAKSYEEFCEDNDL